MSPKNQTNNFQNSNNQTGQDFNGANIGSQYNINIDNLLVTIDEAGIHNNKIIKKLHIVYSQKTKTIDNPEKIINCIEDFLIHRELNEEATVLISTNNLLTFEQAMLESESDKLYFARRAREEKKLCKKIELLFELIFKEYIYCQFFDEKEFFLQIIKNLLFPDNKYKKEYIGLVSFHRSTKYKIGFKIFKKVLDEISLDGKGHEYFLEKLYKGNEIYTGELHEYLAIEFYTSAINIYKNSYEKEDFFSIIDKYLGIA